MEEECGMDTDVEDEIESRKKLVEQKRKLKKELREIEASRVCQKSFRTASRATCSSNCKRWSKGGMTSCQTRKCRQDHKRHSEFRMK